MELIPGFLQGLTRVLISYPFDYIRTNIQTQQYSSLYSYIKKSNISIKDAYRGCSLQLLLVPIDRSLQFFLFEKISKDYPIVIASSISSLISSLYSVPINYYSTKIITEHKPLSLKNAMEFMNISNHYNGYKVDIMKSFIGGFIYTYTYGILRRDIETKYHNYFLFGILSSTATWSIIYPLDTIRVIRQSSTASYTDILNKTKFANYYSGFSIILIRSIPSAGCGMVVYENSRQFLL